MNRFFLFTEKKEDDRVSRKKIRNTNHKAVSERSTISQWGELAIGKVQDLKYAIQDNVYG